MMSTGELLALMHDAITALGYPCVYVRANQHTPSPYVLISVVDDIPVIATPQAGSLPEALCEYTDVDISVYGMGTPSYTLMQMRDACVDACNGIAGSVGCQAKPSGLEAQDNGRMWRSEYATMRYIRR